MRAVPSQAFVADLRLSPVRFCLAVASVAALIGAVAAFTLSKAPMTGAPWPAAYTAPVGGLATGTFVFVVMLPVSAPVWWALCRLNLRGWASSLLAGGVLVTALCSIPVLSGANTIQSSAPLWLVVLGQAPFGLTYGWIIWRISFLPPKPKPSVADTFGPAPEPPPADAERH